MVEESTHGTDLEESDKNDTSLDIFTSHVASDGLGSRIADRSPSLDHIGESCLGVLSEDALNAEREVDQVDEENEAHSHENGVIPEDLSENHCNCCETGRHLKHDHLHEVVLVLTSLGHSNDNILEVVCHENHVCVIFCLRVADLSWTKGDLRLLHHLYVVVTTADNTNAGNGRGTFEIKTLAIDRR